MALQSTGMSLKEIADKYHFPDQSFFGRYFKKHTGMSPKEYRAKKNRDMSTHLSPYSLLL